MCGIARVLLSGAQIIMEYCAGGSVSDLYDATQQTLDQEDIRVILAYTVLGLHHLHTHNSIHRVRDADYVLLCGCYSALTNRCDVAVMPAVALISGCESGQHSALQGRQGKAG